MGTAWVECWKCDACGHRWIKGELYPLQCGKCRSRKWNDDGRSSKRPEPVLSVRRNAQKDGGSGAVDASAVGSYKVATMGDSQPRPTMTDLRAICAGNAPVIEESDNMDIPPCGYREWSGDLGEYVVCGLAPHAPRVKHGAWKVAQ